MQHYVPNKEQSELLCEDLERYGLRIFKPFKPIKGGYRKVY